MIKKVLVTGGAGFVGSNLCKELNKRGIITHSLDNYFTGREENHIDGVKYINASVQEINEIKLDQDYSHVFHLGEYSRVEQSFDDIDLVFEYNHNSIYSILNFVRSINAKIIYSGSSTKFGDGGLNPLESPYAWTKKTNSELVKVFSEWNSIDYAITYFYNAYGENEISTGDYSTLIGKYVNLFKSGSNSLPVVMPGTQVRNFTHISDIVSGLITVGEKGMGDGYGIGSDESYSIIEVAKMFCMEIEYLPERKGNRMTADIKNKKTKELGWKPHRNLKNFINDAIKENERL